jgi:hypothetical protein
MTTRLNLIISIDSSKYQIGQRGAAGMKLPARRHATGGAAITSRSSSGGAEITQAVSHQDEIL